MFSDLLLKPPFVYNIHPCDVLKAAKPFSSVSFGLNWVICFVLIKKVFFLGQIVKKQIAL